MRETTLRDIASLIRDSKSISLILHQNPDGDAISSGVALYRALSPAKQVEIVCTQDIPSVFQSLVGKIPVRSRLSNDTDSFIILDCCELHRTGFGRQLTSLSSAKRPIAVLDHHPRGDLVKITSSYYLDESACATAEIVMELFKEMRVAISSELANTLLIGIYTDTGGFQHANTTSRTLRVASQLVRYGGSIQPISQAFCRQFSPSKKRLWGAVLSEITINDFGIIVARVTKAQLEKTKASIEDVSGLANVLSLTEEARASLVLVETPEGWRGSLRTRHAHINLGKLAKLLGGSGHKKAAGFTTTKTIFSGKIKND